MEFNSEVNRTDYQRAIERSNTEPDPKDLSIYFHLPFYRHLCFYCGCNKIVTKNTDKTDQYLSYLLKEIELHGELAEWDRPVRQLHLGGGTPTFYSSSQIEHLLKHFNQKFTLTYDEKRDYSIEIDPRTVGQDYLSDLHQMGFNRISLGVQDFDPAVQQAIHRIQPEKLTAELIEHARLLEFTSVNIDLIYGLPKQTKESFHTTLSKVIQYAPDRISIYSYAHLPNRFPPQKRIRETDLPTLWGKIELQKQTIETLQANGYVHIGMDHFARGSDPLCQSLHNGDLHRSFQGYTTHRDCDLINMGISAIGEVGGLYYQNTHSLSAYMHLLDNHLLPIEREVKLSKDDKLRKNIIMSIMCNNVIDKIRIGDNYGINFDEYFQTENRKLENFKEDGLLAEDSRYIRVTPRGESCC